jgi:hypothetical protein
MQHEVLLRRTGIVPNTGVRYGPGSAERREECRTASGTRKLRRRRCDHAVAAVVLGAVERGVGALEHVDDGLARIGGDDGLALMSPRPV